MKIRSLTSQEAGILRNTMMIEDLKKIIYCRMYSSIHIGITLK